MAKVRNTMQTIKKSSTIIDTKYDMSTSNIDEIHRCSNDEFEMICNGFRFGYIQGMKAAQNEMVNKN